MAEQIEAALENVENLRYEEEVNMVLYHVPADLDEFVVQYTNDPVVEEMVNRWIEVNDLIPHWWVLVGWHHDHADRDVGGRPETLGL